LTEFAEAQRYVDGGLAGVNTLLEANSFAEMDAMFAPKGKLAEPVAVDDNNPSLWRIVVIGGDLCRMPTLEAEEACAEGLARLASEQEVEADQARRRILPRLREDVAQLTTGFLLLPPGRLGVRA
jgi:hypothetical protein